MEKKHEIVISKIAMAQEVSKEQGGIVKGLEEIRMNTQNAAFHVNELWAMIQELPVSIKEHEMLYDKFVEFKSWFMGIESATNQLINKVNEL
jgi:hypothetical protein